MKNLALTIVALIALAVSAQPAHAFGGLAAQIAANAGQRQNFRQQRALNVQAVRLGIHAQAFVAPIYQQQIVQRVVAQPYYQQQIVQRVVAQPYVQQQIVAQPYVQQFAAPIVQQYSACGGQQLQQGYSQQLNGGGCSQLFAH